MTKKDEPVDPKLTIDYWIKLCQKLHKENEELKEKLRSFRGY
jgi:hypothetical protein